MFAIEMEGRTMTTTAPTVSPDPDLRQALWDIALRDFGLLIAAVALAHLAAVFAPALRFDGRSR